MFKRATVVLLALILPLTIVGAGGMAGADAPDGPSAPDWRALPDLEADSGRFLVVSGLANAGLPGGPGNDPMQLVVRVFFEDDGGDDDVRVSVFDGDTTGLWDQRDDLEPVAPESGIERPYDTRYRLYPDPTGTVASALAAGDSTTADPVPPVVNMSARDPLDPIYGTNATWCSIYNGAGHEGEGGGPDARTEDGRFAYTLRVTLEAGPNALTGYEVNGFKLAYTGRMLVPEGSVLGVMGGAIDQREARGVLITEDPWAADPMSSKRIFENPADPGSFLTNGYQGEWSLPIDGNGVCGDVVFFEGDSDWNAPIDPADPFGDPDPTGLPPDDGGRFAFTDPVTQIERIIDSSNFRIELPQADQDLGRHGLVWEIVAPNADIVWSSDDTPLGHPAYTGSIQYTWNQTNLPPDVFAEAQSFLPTTLEEAGWRVPGRQIPGQLWDLRWRGADARNVVWVRWSGDMGSVERITTGRLFCDENLNGEYDAGEPPLVGVTVEITPQAGGDTITVTTDQDGIWSATLGAAVYSLDVPNMDCPRPLVDLPIVFDSCDGGPDVPFDCDCTGSISGRVYCDNDISSTFVVPPDSALDGVTVTLTLAGDALPTATTTTAADGTYSFTDVEAGTWLVSVDASQAPLTYLHALSPTSLTVVLAAEEDKEDVDFRFLCLGDLSGRVYCDNDESEQFTLPPDKALGGVTVTITQTGVANPFVGSTTTVADGTYSFSGLPVGEYTVAVDPSQAALAGTTALSPTSRNETVTALAPTTDVDFRFRCPSTISGHVYREVRPADGVYQPGNGEEPIAGVEVTLKRLDDPLKGPWTTTTDTAGYYEFMPVDPGTYRVEVDETQAAVVRLKATFPSPAVISPVVVDPLTEYPGNDFFFGPAEIQVRVFRKAHGEACLNVIDVGDTPIAGVEVSLVGTSPVVPVQLAVTDALGEASFDNLEAGTYQVTVAGSQTPLTLYVPAPGADVQSVALGAGELEVVPSIWCEDLCSITGFVLREGQDCVEWWQGGGIPGVTVELRRDTDAPTDPAWKTDTTDATGSFSFLDIQQGAYVVSVPDGQAVLVDMTALTDTVVVVPQCPAEVTFVYGTVGLTVEVLIDIDCGGTADGGISTVVTLEKLDEPGMGRIWTGTSDPGTGQVQFPTTNALPEGLYRVSIPPQPMLIPKGPLEQAIQLVVCEPQTLQFEFCGTGSIIGTVIKEIVDCDAVRQPGEPGIVGVTVVLTPVTPGGTPISTTTNGDGDYYFLNLGRGSYLVSVDGSQPVLVNYDPTSPTSMDVMLIPPAEERVDFFFCAPARLYGYVFEEPIGQADGIYDPGTDTGIGAVSVSLVFEGGITLPPASTDGGGFYAFEDLQPGAYTVSVDGSQPMLIYLSPTTALSVGPFTLAPEEERREDFGFTSQAIQGTVFLEPEGACNGIYDAGDVGIAGVAVHLLKLTEPDLGLARDTSTSASGDYLFTDIPAGLYEISIPGGQAVLVGLAPSSTQPLTPILLPGASLLDQDFGYCPPLQASICGKVFVNPWGSDCDQIFQQGDEPLIGVEVVLEKIDEPNMGWTTYELTDANGDYCFEGLSGGLYEVRVPDGQPQLVDLDPAGPTAVVVTLPSGAQETVDFPYCEPCPKVPCCVGDIHEVIVETRFWVDEWHEWYDVYAWLYDDCCPGAREIDFAGVWYRGEFPGSVTGYNDVLTLESVRMVGNWAIVRLRLTAQGCAFPRGFFGNKCRSLVVTFNGRRNVGETIIRCEHVRPGSWFTWCDACGFPDCPEEIDPKVLAAMIMEGPPDGCNGRFLTIDTYGWENWLECEPPPDCKDQSETCECGYNTVALELDYWVEHGERHRFDLELKKWGVDVIDALAVCFTGNEWHGRKKGWGNVVLLTDVWLVEKGRYADLWRMRVHIQACDRRDGNPGALPEQLEVATKLDNWRHDFWLDLNPGDGQCLELGPRYWEGEHMGINILRWLSVEDAAWCPPNPCRLPVDMASCNCGK